MIVKTNRDGKFYVAGNSNWRLAGPFETNAEAWAWIDQNGFKHDHEGSPAPSPDRKHIRKLRFHHSVTKELVLALAPKLLADEAIDDKTRGFVMDMQKRARRKGPGLRLTEKQARWWHGVVRRYRDKHPREDQEKAA